MNLKTLSLLAISAVGSIASAQVVDFEDITPGGTDQGGFIFYDPTFVSRGYQFDATVNVFNGALASWTSSIGGYYTGSVALFGNYTNEVIRMTKSGGGAFDINSIDLCDVYRGSGSGMVVTLFGTRADSSTVTANISLTDSSNLLTYAVSGMTNVVSVDIYDNDQGASPWFQMDNINTVPEPASMIALGAGALALLRRRNRK